MGRWDNKEYDISLDITPQNTTIINEAIRKAKETKDKEQSIVIRQFSQEVWNLQKDMFQSKGKVDLSTPDSINGFYRLDKITWKPIFQLNKIMEYLNSIYERLSSKKTTYKEMNKQNNFTWTILAIQIALKTLGKDPINPKTYNIRKIDWQYDTTKEVIKQFQLDHQLWNDGKPWIKTIEALISSLRNFINNRKTYEHIRSTVKNVLVSNTLTMLNSWVLNSERDSILITNYITKWKLGTGENADLERKINDLAGMKFGNLEFKKIIKEWKENGRLNILNQDPEFQNTKYDKLIIQLSNKYSNNYKIDPALIKIIMHKESRFDPKAHSGAWAKWLMQLMPIAVKEANREKTIIKNVYDPKQNIEWGIKIFGKHLETFKWNISLALAAYNWGPNSLDKFFEKKAKEMSIKKEKLIAKARENKEFFEKKIKDWLPWQTIDYINKIVPKYESLQA